MGYILRDIIDYIDESSQEYGERLSQKDFWKIVFNAAGLSTEPLSESNMSRWTNGRNHLKNEYVREICHSSYKVENAINQLLEQYSCDNEKLKEIFKRHQVYSLLSIDEKAAVGYIIAQIILHHKSFAPEKNTPEVNFCVQNFPYPTENNHIIPIEEVQERFHDIFNRYNYMIISGISGIGRLSQVTYYIEKCKYNFYYYLTFNTSLEYTISSYDFSKACVMPLTSKNYNSPEADNIFNQQLNHLNGLKNRALVVIDNIGSSIQNDPQFNTLVNSQANIIFLTTCYYPQADNIVNLPSLNKEQCIQLFQFHCPRLSNSNIQNSNLYSLLDKLSYHTLALTLIAKLIQNSSLSIDDVNSKIQNNTLVDSNTIISQTKKNHHISENTYHDLILDIFDLEDITSSLLIVLKQAALLPATGYNRISFNYLIDDLESNKINTLHKQGWIYINQNQNTIFMHPLIRDCIMYKFPPSPSLYPAFLKNYVLRIDTEDYENETEELLLGIELIKRLHENSLFWLEVSYMILRFLKNQRLCCSVMNMLLNKCKQISISDILDTINQFCCRHVEIMYRLFESQDYKTCDLAFTLAKDVTDFASKITTIPTLIFIDLLRAMGNNLYELIINPEVTFPKQYFIFYRKKLSDYYLKYIQILNTNTFPSCWNESYSIIPYSIKCDIWIRRGEHHNHPDIAAQTSYIKGLDAVYIQKYETALECLNQAYQYYQCHSRYQFNYHSLHIQYLILICQKQLGIDLNKKILNHLIDTFKNLPELQSRSERFKDLQDEFERRIIANTDF